jgi:hypothetical protein
MTVTQILSQNLTKGKKIRALRMAGLDKNDIVSLGFKSSYVGKIFRKHDRELRAALGTQAGFQFQFNRTFGIEIEAYNANKTTIARKLREAGINTYEEGYNHETRSHWKVIYDSSINGNDSFELVSPILSGADGLEQVKTVCRVLKENHVKVNRSCGLHVHIDARDFTTGDWKNIYRNYAGAEETIDSFMPMSRRGNGNTYCHSVKTYYTRSIDGATSLRSIQDNYGFGSRYFKLNTKSFWRHQTVEFRQHSGTIEFEKISNWVLFVSRFVEYTKAGGMIENDNLDSLRPFCDNEVMSHIENRIELLAS